MEIYCLFRVQEYFRIFQFALVHVLGLHVIVSFTACYANIYFAIQNRWHPKKEAAIVIVMEMKVAYLHNKTDCIFHGMFYVRCVRNNVQ